uniref:Protein kinase n=1 Tax=Pithovirus LCPAC103 TaxID=2506588 RepID=A0A481Z4E9_9VIRU|nr:MAG: protein kinase [Pithovirus LCPAC103]
MWGGDSPIVVDSNCQCQLGAYHKLSLEQRIGLEDVPEAMYLGEYYKCINCSALGTLMDLDTGLDNFIIEYGSRLGQKFDIHRLARGIRFLKCYQYPKHILAQLLRNRNYINCEPGATELVGAEFYGADAFTTQVLVHIYVESILRKQLSEDRIPFLATAFVCGQDNYLVLRAPAIEKLTDISSPLFTIPIGTDCEDRRVLNFKVVYGLLYQLISFFWVLKDYQFSYGDPGWDKLSFNTRPIVLTMAGITCICPVSLIIAISANCSITTVTTDGKANRIFQYTDRDSKTLRRTPFRPKVESMTFNFTNCVTAEGACRINKAYVYQLPTDTSKSDMSALLRQLGAFMYPSSLGLYCFLCLLMTEPSFYYGVKTNSTLNALWQSFFLAYDLPIIESRLKLADGSNIIKLLKGIYLRCDAVKHGWDLIKIINERS